MTLLVELVETGDIQAVENFIDNMIVDNGYNPREVVNRLRRFILSSKKLSHEKKINALKSAGDIEFRISQGASPQIQLKTFMVYLIKLCEVKK